MSLQEQALPKTIRSEKSRKSSKHKKKYTYNENKTNSPDILYSSKARGRTNSDRTCKISKLRLVLTIDNECENISLDELLVKNKKKLEKIVIDTLIDRLEGKFKEKPDHDLIYEKTLSGMENYLKTLNFINSHTKTLLSEGIINDDVKESEIPNFYTAVYKKFTEEIGPVKKYPYIQDIFAAATKEMKKKETKKKEEFWEKWLKKKTQVVKTPVKYDVNTCIECIQCAEGKIPNLTDFFNFVEMKLLKQYPDILSGRKVVERETDLQNFKLMCLKSESKETIISVPEETVEEEITPVFFTEKIEELVPPKPCVCEVKSVSIDLSADILSVDNFDKKVKCYPEMPLDYEDISKVSL